MLDLHIQLLSCSRNRHSLQDLHSQALFSHIQLLSCSHSTHTHTNFKGCNLKHYVHTHKYSFSPADTKDSLQRLHSQLLYSKKEKVRFHIFKMLLQSCLEHKVTLRMVKYQTVRLAENKGYKGVIFLWPPPADHWLPLTWVLQLSLESKITTLRTIQGFCREECVMPRFTCTVTASMHVNKLQLHKLAGGKNSVKSHASVWQNQQRARAMLCPHALSNCTLIWPRNGTNKHAESTLYLLQPCFFSEWWAFVACIILYTRSKWPIDMQRQMHACVCDHHFNLCTALSVLYKSLSNTAH